jgi:hypothetical protein
MSSTGTLASSNSERGTQAAMCKSCWPHACRCRSQSRSRCCWCCWYVNRARASVYCLRSRSRCCWCCWYVSRARGFHLLLAVVVPLLLPGCDGHAVQIIVRMLGGSEASRAPDQNLISLACPFSCAQPARASPPENLHLESAATVLPTTLSSRELSKEPSSLSLSLSLSLSPLSMWSSAMWRKDVEEHQLRVIRFLHSSSNDCNEEPISCNPLIDLYKASFGGLPSHCCELEQQLIVITYNTT